jgi:predicted transcriptional regulator
MIRENNRLAPLPDLSYTAQMKSLTIRLPDVLARRIEQAAVARGVSKSDIVREGLDQQELPPLQDGGMRAILEESWAAQVPSKPRRFRSPKKQKIAEIIRAKKLHR